MFTSTLRRQTRRTDVRSTNTPDMNSARPLPRAALLIGLALLAACQKEEEAPKQYDECGNEICETCGGITIMPNAAIGHIWVQSADYTAMSEAVRVYNADDPDQYQDIAAAMDDDLPADHFCGNSTNGNVARFVIQPGTTLRWKAYNASNTKQWEGTLRNPDCMDGTDCYTARITYPW